LILGCVLSLLAATATSAAEGCKPGEKWVVTHPVTPGAPPESRIRCGTTVAPDVIEVPPSAPVAAPAPAARPVRIVRVVVVKRVYIRARPRHRTSHGAHGPFDFLFHH
jgi:hypothetical protein